MEMNIDGTVMMDMILEPSTAHLQTNLKMDVFGIKLPGCFFF